MYTSKHTQLAPQPWLGYRILNVFFTLS